MKKVLFIAGMLINSILTWAQSEQNIWAFGEGAGLNFNVAGPASYTDNLVPGYEGCAAICNATGQMLFYSNGLWVWDKYDHLMPALTGGVSGYSLPVSTSVGYPPLMPYTGGAATQAAAICNAPMQPGRYYLFSLNTNGQLFYSLIDTSLNSGSGDIVTGMKGVYMGGGFTEKMTLVKGCNNIWLITRSKTSNQYKSFEIRDTGIVLTPVVSNAGKLPLTWYQDGVIKFSPDGTKMAAACNYGGVNIGGLELYDFDYRTGILSNARVLDSSSSDGYYYGACFSQDNTKLYATTSSYSIGSIIHPGRLKQFNVSLGSTAAIIASNILIYADTATQTRDLGDLKRAVDGKIYISSQNAVSAAVYMHNISSPNAAGPSCGFVPNAVALPLGSWLYKGLPNDVVILNNMDTVKTINNVSACFIDSISIAALDTFGKNYMWQDNTSAKKFVVHTNGIYSVGYVNSNCKYQLDIFNVNFVHVPIISSTSYSCNSQRQGIAWAKSAAGDTARFTFTWFDANGNILQQHVSYKSDSIRGLDTGFYTVQVHSIGGCDTTLHVRIVGIPSPTAFATIDSIVCKGNGAIFSASTDGAAWKWYFGDGTTTDSLSSTHYYKQAKNYTVQFVTSNIEGCSDTVTRIVQVKTFVIDLSSDKDNVHIGELITLQTTSSEAYTVTEWEPANMFSDPSAFTQTLNLDTTHTFIVFGQSAYGCIDSAMITLFVNPEVFLPSAFTPNGDGLNDRFRPRTAGSGIFIDDFEIYNRWGQMVWYGYGANAAEGWDGKFHGIDAEIGTYFYTIHMVTHSGGTLTQKGDVTLIR
ncbi:MAG: hypothetical protein BGO69_05440 [Bacteroidetes bacterium 46-16]|nr:MAG: hypothetical protein BGO69_05440 [Bacteroidetes bacterium 46-16]